MSKMFANKALFFIISIYLLFKDHVLVECTSQLRSTDNFSKQDIIDTVQDIGREISYAQWANDPSANVILSPFSIAVILNLLMLGTRGKTNLEIKQTLNYPNDLQESSVHETYQEIFASLPQTGNGVEISLHTRLFPNEEFEILASYTDVSETSYLSEVESLDFNNFPLASTDRINSWVSESTNGKIGKLFSDPLSSLTVCAIVNVIFLNATWENKFPSSSTRDGIFYTETDEEIIIPMMNSEMRVPYLENDNDGYEIISLPYVGNRFSMYILKPTGESNLQQIENTLYSNDLNFVISEMSTRRMNVTIPRMKMSQDLDLISDLKSLGINQIFSKTSADFTRFTEQIGVYVSDVKHKAILEVREAGTVAAAVTGAVIESRSTAPSKFVLNKPSLVFIRDNENGLILFWARVMKPEPLLD